MKKGRRFGDIVSNVYLILLSIVAVFPLLWLLVSAFKSSSEMLNNPTKIWPIEPSDWSSDVCSSDLPHKDLAYPMDTGKF